MTNGAGRAPVGIRVAGKTVTAIPAGVGGIGADEKNKDDEQERNYSSATTKGR